MLRTTAITILLSATVLPAGAQDHSADHVRVLLEELASATSYHAKARVDLYDATGKLMSSETTEAYGSGNNFRSTIGERTTVMNGTEFLFVDGTEKHMIYQTRTTPLPSGAAAGDLKAQISAMLDENSAHMRIYEQDVRTVTIRVDGDAEGYDHTDIVLCKKDHLLERVVYHVGGAARQLGQGRVLDRIEIVYTLLELNTIVDPDQFSTRPYVRPGKNGMMVPAAAYHDHELTQNSGT